MVVGGKKEENKSRWRWREMSNCWSSQSPPAARKLCVMCVKYCTAVPPYSGTLLALMKLVTDAVISAYAHGGNLSCSRTFTFTPGAHQSWIWPVPSTNTTSQPSVATYIFPVGHWALKKFRSELKGSQVIMTAFKRLNLRKQVFF